MGWSDEREFPAGAVTFLFSDIEGSARLVKVLRERYAEVLAEHRRLVSAAIADRDGHEVDAHGDAFVVAFNSAKQAVLCALEIQRAVARHGGRPRPCPGADRRPHRPGGPGRGRLYGSGGPPRGADLRSGRRRAGAGVPGDAGHR